MASNSKTSQKNKDNIIKLYMQYVLEHETEPKSVFKFCKGNNVKEEEFYANFGSLETLKEHIWVSFHEKTLELLEKNKDYASYESKEKMLSFFYTFFELLTLNRSYMLFTLPNAGKQMENLLQLKGLRRKIKDFAAELIDAGNENKNLKITKQNPKIYSEGAWLQFLFLLRFWLNDTSPGFEKTDLAIEKSVKTVFDLFDNTPLEGVIDFGKFLYKETFA